MKTFSILVVILSVLGSLSPAHSAWTKVAGSDSTRLLAAAYVVYSWDEAGEAIVAGRGDSAYALGAYPQWSKGTFLGAGNVAAGGIVGSYFVVGTATGRSFRRFNYSTDWSEFADSPLANGTAFRVFALSGSTLFAGTSQGVFRSNFLGPWTSLNSGLSQLSVRALSASGSFLCAATDSGLFISLNSGTSWSSKSPVRAKAQVRFLTGSGNRLLAATDSGIFRSTDSGSTWTALNNGLANKNSYGLVEADVHLFAATEGGFYRSTNSGAAWVRVDSSVLSGPVHAVRGIGYGYGRASSIYVENNAGIWGERFPDVAVGVEGGASGNYPDFRIAGRTLSYKLSKSSRVLLEAYAASGKRVAILLDEGLPAGTHHRTFSAATLPSGLYIFRLKTDQGVASRLVPVSR